MRILRLKNIWKLALGVVAVTILATLIVAAAWPSKRAVAIVETGDGNNVAVAINTRDNSSVFKFLFKIIRTNKQTVEQQNAAIAYASCKSCQTVAAAYQIILITNPDVKQVAPANVAIAINQNCTDCQTLASAYQYVLTTGGPVRFTPEGNRRLAQIRKEIQQLRKSGLSIQEIQARLAGYDKEISNILATQLVPAGKDEDEKKDKERDNTREETHPGDRTNGSTNGSSTNGKTLSTTPEQQPHTEATSAVPGQTTATPDTTTPATTGELTATPH